MRQAKVGDNNLWPTLPFCFGGRHVCILLSRLRCCMLDDLNANHPLAFWVFSREWANAPRQLTSGQGEAYTLSHVDLTLLPSSLQHWDLSKENEHIKATLCAHQERACALSGCTRLSPGTSSAPDSPETIITLTNFCHEGTLASRCTCHPPARTRSLLKAYEWPVHTFDCLLRGGACENACRYVTFPLVQAMNVSLHAACLVTRSLLPESCCMHHASPPLLASQIEHRRIQFLEWMLIFRACSVRLLVVLFVETRKTM